MGVLSHFTIEKKKKKKATWACYVSPKLGVNDNVKLAGDIFR